MKLKKRIFWSALVFIIVVVSFWVGLLPITIDCNEDYLDKIEVVKGKEFNPLSTIDISDNCEIYLNISLDDIYSDQKILNGKVFKCSDINVLIGLKNNFNFTYTGSDIATANSRIYVYQNDKLVFSSSIVLEEGIFGLQSSNFGWVKKNELIPYFKKFKRVYLPLVVF